jgi:putative SOS response-associated peptidase YedK
MCGLYSFRKPPEEVKAMFAYPEQPNFPPRDHVAPAQPIAIVRGEDDERHFGLVRWGFVPSWTKEVKPGKPLINARSETVYEKPSFRHAIRRRRCLIPADGFYEWKGDVPGRKQPFHITQANDDLFAFGGIWEHWTSPDGSELESAAILTTEPNAMMARIHTRMPVVIKPENFSDWLDHSRPDGKSVEKLMHPVEDDFFMALEIEMPRPARKPKQPRIQQPGLQPEKPPDDQLKLL